MPRLFRPILSAIEKAAEEGLTEAAKETLKRAKERVPVDTGGLKRSGRVTVDDLSVTVRFHSPHAYLVHEHTEWQHPNGGQAKFLETAALEIDLGAYVAHAARATFGG